jgi:hypothetical protein
VKRLVRNDIGLGMVLAVPTFIVAAITRADTGAIYLIAIGFLAIAIAWRRFDGSL